jgi:hypothetical protein
MNCKRVPLLLGEGRREAPGESQVYTNPETLTRPSPMGQGELPRLRLHQQNAVGIRRRRNRHEKRVNVG